MPYLEYCGVLKWESRFTLRLNAAENTDYIKNGSNKSCSELNFLQKSQWAHMSISFRCGAMGAKMIAMFEIL